MPVEFLHKLRLFLGDRRLGHILRWLPFLAGEWLLRRPGRASRPDETRILFDAEYYASRYPDAPRSWRAGLAHYLAAGADQGRNPSPLFATTFYLDRYPDVRASGQNPLIHFATAGAFEGRDPHPLFQTSYYLERNRPAVPAGSNPLAHFLLQGWKERRSPHPLFDTGFYLDNYPEAAARLNPLADYYENGAVEGRNPNSIFDTRYYLGHCPELRDRGVHPLVHYSGPAGFEYDPSPLFDTRYYLAQYPDVSERGVNPLLHYLHFGAALGCNPHPLFDTPHYVRCYPDVTADGWNPLGHYLRRGWKEGRFPNPLFDSAWYLRQYPDVESEDRNPLADYWEHGLSEGRNPNAFFDTRDYAARCAGALSSGLNPLIHYLREGGLQGCEPSARFSSSFYLEANPDVAAAGLNPLVHYLWIGREQGREPVPGPSHAAAAAQPAEDDAARARLISGAYAPLVSVVMPVYNTPPEALRLAIESVRRQSYPHWELCVVDDGSGRADTAAILDALPKDDPRWKVRRLPENQGISLATNAALEMARGDLVAFLDHDDELAPDALMEAVAEWNAHPDADAVYTDQQTVSEDGKPVWTFHKPDWSPEFFRGLMYVGHLLVIRRGLVAEASGCDPAFDTIQDYELLLRISERTQRIRHIRRVLYSWRQSPGSVAAGPREKPGIDRLQRAAVQAHLDRIGLSATAESHPRHPHRVVLAARQRPIVQIVEAVPGLAVDDLEENAVALFRALGATAPDDAMALLAMYAMQPDAGCVSPLILRQDGRVHNAGLGVTCEGDIRYGCSGWSPDFDGYAGELSCAREVSLVSGHYTLISARALRRIGGWDESYGTPLHRGLDLSLRARSTGLRNLCVAAVVATAAAEQDGAEAAQRAHAQFRERWATELRQPDPYWHDGFRHPSHLRVKDAARIWAIEDALKP